nr:unnamed protein product [Digitaria exilis]
MPSTQSQGRYLKQAHRAWLMACIPSCLEQHARHAADSSETKQAKSHSTGLASTAIAAWLDWLTTPKAEVSCVGGFQLNGTEVLAAIWADLVEGIRSLPTAPPSHHGSPQLAAAVADRSGYFLSSSMEEEDDQQKGGWLLGGWVGQTAAASCLPPPSLCPANARARQHVGEQIRRPRPARKLARTGMPMRVRQSKLTPKSHGHANDWQGSHRRQSKREMDEHNIAKEVMPDAEIIVQELLHHHGAPTGN